MAQPQRLPSPRDLDRLLAFINSLDREDYEREGINEALATIESATAFLRNLGVLSVTDQLAGRDLARLKSLRECLRAVLAANAGQGDLTGAWRALQWELGRARYGLSLQSTAASSSSMAIVPTGSGADRVAAIMIGLLYDAIQNGDFDRLKACSSKSCQWAFYDASKNRTGEWCSMAICGNRAKARRRRRRSADM